MGKRVEEARKALEDAQKALEDAERMEEEDRQNPPTRAIAELLHEKLCHANHTDGCGWFYGSWDNQSWAHKRYYEMAERVVAAGITIEDVEKMFDTIYGG